MDLVSDLGMINPNIAAEQLSPNATTSTASSGIESFLSNPSGLSILPQSDDGANGGIDEKEDRPSLSYKDLIVEAIESSPEKRLKLSEIYQVSSSDGVSLASAAVHHHAFFSMSTTDHITHFTLARV